MKRFCALILALVMALSMVACGNEGGSNKGNPSSGTKTVDTIDMEEAGGNLTYLGYEFVPEDFYLFNDYDGYTAEKTVVIKFTYTNNEDAEKTSAQDFTIKGYQNGAEMPSPLNWNHSYSLESLDNAYLRKTVIQDGTIEVGFAFIIKDDSPLTITATYNGETKSVQKMNLALEDIPSAPAIIVSDRSELFGEWIGINTGYSLTLTDSQWRLSYGDGGGPYSSGWNIIGNRLSFGSQTDYDFKIEEINGVIHLIANENGIMEEFTDDYIRK